MVKITVSGGRGIMGRLICRAVEESPDSELSGILEAPGHPDEGKEFSGALVTSDTAEASEESDVIIDFSVPEATMNILPAAIEKKKAVVIGTTGFTTSQLEDIKTAAAEIPLLLSPNMSVGVNLLFKTAAMINEFLKGLGYDLEIIEAHHSRKADAPSGTAVRLFDILSDGSQEMVNGRSGRPGPRKEKEIGMHAVRGGSITGEHTLMWVGQQDRIELTHRASSRMIFAQGAVRAALWLSNTERGKVYGMEDVLCQVKK